MAGKHAELRLGSAGRRVLLVPSTAVVRPRVEMLVGGSHVLVELPAEHIPLRGPPSPTDRTTPDPEPAPSLAPRSGTRLRVRVVLDDAAALAGAGGTTPRDR